MRSFSSPSGASWRKSVFYSRRTGRAYQGRTAKGRGFRGTKIHFKPPVVEQLAKEAGIEPAVIDLLKKCGITSEEELIARLGIKKEHPADVDQEREERRGREPEGSGGEGTGDGGMGGMHRSGGQKRSAGDGGEADRRSGETRGGGVRQKAGGSSGRPFISYLGMHPDETSLDPDGLAYEQRLALEDEAITFILSREPDLQRTTKNNPGFDLMEIGLDEAPIRWVEVKAMTGSLADRAVGMSRAQFEEARRRGNRYWLYVVEHAGDPEARRVLRIQDPAGKARTFTLDHGWLCVADMDSGFVEPDEGGKG